MCFVRFRVHNLDLEGGMRLLENRFLGLVGSLS